MSTYFLLAQTSYSYSATSTGSSAAGLVGMLIGLVVVLVLMVGFSALMFWKVLEKGGKPGWASMVPIYNAWLLFEMSGKNGALALIFLGGLIPFVGVIFSLIGAIMLGQAVGKAFGKSGGFVVGLVLLGVVFYPILGFGEARYLGPEGAAPAEGFPVLPPRQG